jgi:hypothetical protein
MDAILGSHRTIVNMAANHSQGQTGINLKGLAGVVAAECEDKGAVVISYGEGGVRIGVENLTPQELREALCTAIHYSFVFEKEPH